MCEISWREDLMSCLGVELNAWTWKVDTYWSWFLRSGAGYHLRVKTSTITWLVNSGTGQPLAYRPKAHIIPLQRSTNIAIPRNPTASSSTCNLTLNEKCQKKLQLAWLVCIFRSISLGSVLRNHAAEIPVLPNMTSRVHFTEIHRLHAQQPGYSYQI